MILEILLAFPVLITAYILQTTLMVRITLLSGFPDLTMLILIAWVLQEDSKYAWIWAIMGGLIIGFSSAIPWFIFSVSYLMIIVIAQRFKSSIWQNPVLAMMLMTALGTFILLGAEFIALQVMGINLIFSDILTRTILPSMLLNLLIAFPIYFLMKEFGNLLYPNKNV
jgi:cell shape-determining protein MreD